MAPQWKRWHEGHAVEVYHASDASESEMNDFIDLFFRALYISHFRAGPAG